MIDPDVKDDQETWHHAGDIAQQALADIANKDKDRADEILDAQRAMNGITLDWFLANK